MNKKTGLIPTVTTDKNGKVTTVYTKPVGGSETNSVIPAPTFAKEASTGHTATVDRVTSAVYELMDGKKKADRIKATLAAYPEALVAKLDDKFAKKDHGVYALATAVENGETPSFVGEAMEFGQYFQTDSVELANCMIRSLHQYKQLPSMEDYSLAPKDVQEQCNAILTVTEALDNHAYFNDVALPLKYTPSTGGMSNDYTVLQGDDLIALILERPRDAETIADLIIERQTGDAELLREIITQEDSKALNPGIL